MDTISEAALLMLKLACLVLLSLTIAKIVRDKYSDVFQPSPKGGTLHPQSRQRKLEIHVSFFEDVLSGPTWVAPEEPTLTEPERAFRNSPKRVLDQRETLTDGRTKEFSGEKNDEC
jgi:hypothetical protein